MTRLFTRSTLSLLAPTFLAFTFARAALPINVTILTQEDFRNHHYFSVGDALAGVTSLKVERDGYRGTRTLVKIRGLSSAKDVLVLVDGRPLTHEFDSEVDLTQIPLSMVDRIEITRGGSSVSYSGEAVAGTIHVITNRPEQKGLVTDLGTGVGRYGVKHSFGKFTGRSNVGDITYDASNEDSGGFSDNENFETTNHFGNFTRSFNGKGYWGGEYFFHDSRVGVSNGTFFPLSEWNGELERAPSTPSPERRQESQHAKVFLARPLLGGGTTYATFTESFRHFDDRPVAGGIEIRDQDSRVSTFDLSWRGGKNVEMGAQMKKLKREIFPEPSHEVFQNAAYLLAKWTNEQWTVAPGLRVDRHSKSGNFLTPRVAFLFAPEKSWTFSITAERAHRLPNFDELFLSSVVINNPDLNAEKSNSCDLGVRWTPSENAELKVTGFLTRIDDLIAPNPNTNRFENGGTEKSNGIESEGTLKGKGGSFLRNFDLSANWTMQESRRALADAPAFVSSALSPRHVAFIKLDHRLPHAMLITNELRYQSDQYELDNHEGVHIPAFYVWNFRYSLRILAADMYFEVDNVSQRRYAETVNHFLPTVGPATTALAPQADRTFWAGVTIRFEN